MPKYFYDLHMHSALSPCAQDDMTPNNMVNMAKLCGLDIIALTDHNTCKNTPAFLEAAQQAGVTALPGMELCCAEECHIICLFTDLKGAMDFDEFVSRTLPPIKNEADIFGQQLIFSAQDVVCGRVDTLLITASSISVDDILPLVRQFGGAAFPAHIDRPSYSIIASLGTVPPIGFMAVEITKHGDLSGLKQQHIEIVDKPLLLNSDAHMLADIQEAGPWLELVDLNPTTVINALNNQFAGKWAR